MIKGLSVFTRHFADYSGHYVLIGGGACDVQFRRKQQQFRGTKDFDIVLIVEALTPAFVRHFWDFVKAGGYMLAQIDEKKRFYRFVKPSLEDYPTMLELFARHPDVLPPIPDIHITDIPTDEDLSSLSAILMTDEYYQFTIVHSEVVDGVRVANDRALIALKARAYLNNRERRNNGEKVQEQDIVKHRSDVLRLIATLPDIEPISVPEMIKADLLTYINILPGENVIIKDVFKPLGLTPVPVGDLLQRLREVFVL